MTTERTWTITDINGKNPRTVTLAQYMAAHNARKAAANPIMDAFRRGDLAACGVAQEAMRKQFKSAYIGDDIPVVS